MLLIGIAVAGRHIEVKQQRRIVLTRHEAVSLVLLLEESTSIECVAAMKIGIHRIQLLALRAADNGVTIQIITVVSRNLAVRRGEGIRPLLAVLDNGTVSIIGVCNAKRIN